MPKVRQASHAGSWYTDDGEELSAQLSEWLSDVSPTSIPSPLNVCTSSSPSSTNTSPLPLPIPGCRAVIAPHAGYSYSGPAAAYAYSTIDPNSSIKRIFILGPSHHVYLDGCAVTACDSYATPLGDLPVDKEIIEELKGTGKFSVMSKGEDEDEHSLEMHLPYIRKVFQGKDVTIVPIMVGSINTSKENLYGKLLAAYLQDDKNFFVISSDFCHWGTRFRYTYYKPSGSTLATSLNSRSPKSSFENPPIHQSIRDLDESAILAITHPYTTTNGKGENKTAEQARTDFAQYLAETKNTVCGRHPIGVLLAALAHLEEIGGTQSELRFTRYEQSSKVKSPGESSVSYASAFVRFAK